MAKKRKGIKVRHRLLTRLLLSHILIVAIPLFLTGRVLVNTAQESIQQTVLDRNYRFALRSTRLIELRLENARDIINSQARNLSTFALNPLAQELTLNAIVSEFDLFNRLSILDTAGNVVATTVFANDSQTDRGGNHFLPHVLSGQSYRSDVYHSAEHLPMLDIAEPIRRHNEVVGALYAVVDLKAMWDLVEENVVGEKGEAFIFNYNKNGEFVAHSDPKNVYMKQAFQNQDILDKLRGGRHGSTIYATPGDVQMVAAYAAIGTYGWGFMIQQPTSEAFAPAHRMRLRVWQFMLGSALLASLLAFFYTRWIVTPVNRLVSGMDRFSKGDMTYRIEKVENDEIGALAQNFNDMADRLIEFQHTLKRTERFETLGKLASVLSHEIRNPLNSMVINMQILKREISRERMDKAKVEKFYDILASEIKRVDQLVTDFLLISRPPKLERSRVKLAEVLDDVITLKSAEALEHGVRIERVYKKKQVEAHVDVGKMKQVFLNLIINALQALPGGGKLTVELDETSPTTRARLKLKGKYATVIFRDTGHGISKEEMSKIFDFYYSTKKEGSGLGLAIVQQIIEEHNGVILVDSKVNAGTTFTVYLPQEAPVSTS